MLFNHFNAHTLMMCVQHIMEEFICGGTGAGLIHQCNGIMMINMIIDVTDTHVDVLMMWIVAEIIWIVSKQQHEEQLQ